MATKVVGYECPRCDKVHPNKWDATHCCLPRKVTFWRCVYCEEEYNSRLTAEHHEETCPKRSGTCQECEHCDIDGYRWGPCPKYHRAPQHLTCDHFEEVRG